MTMNDKHKTPRGYSSPSHPPPPGWEMRRRAYRSGLSRRRVRWRRVLGAAALLAASIFIYGCLLVGVVSLVTYIIG